MAREQYKSRASRQLLRSISLKKIKEYLTQMFDRVYSFQNKTACWFNLQIWGTPFRHCERDTVPSHRLNNPTKSFLEVFIQLTVKSKG